MKRTLTPELTTYAYLRLFPERHRRKLYSLQRSHFKTSAEWIYILQALGEVLTKIIAQLFASYLLWKLKNRGTEETVETSDVFERLPGEYITAYKRILRRAKVQLKKEGTTSPKYVIRIVDRHEKLSALPPTDLIKPIIVQTVHTPMKVARKFIKKYYQQSPTGGRGAR